MKSIKSLFRKPSGKSKDGLVEGEEADSEPQGSSQDGPKKKEEPIIPIVPVSSAKKPDAGNSTDKIARTPSAPRKQDDPPAAAASSDVNSVRPLTSRRSAGRAAAGGGDQSTFGGVGIQLVWRRSSRPPSGDAADAPPGDGRRVLVKLIRGPPADTADIKVGDELLEVDGAAVAALDPEEVVKLLRGRHEQPVTLLLRRAGGAPHEVNLVRRSQTAAAAILSAPPGSARPPAGPNGLGAAGATGRVAASGRAPDADADAAHKDTAAGGGWPPWAKSPLGMSPFFTGSPARPADGEERPAHDNDTVAPPAGEAPEGLAGIWNGLRGLIPACQTCAAGRA